MKKSISIKELKTILDEMPKQRIELECHAWGCCSAHYTEVVKPSDVIYHVEKYLKNALEPQSISKKNQD